MKLRGGLVLVGVVSLGVSACTGNAEQEARETLARDSSLTRELRLPSDTSAYTDAADVAFDAVEDTTTRIVNLPRRNPLPSARPPVTIVPASPAPSLETPRPAPPPPPATDDPSMQPVQFASCESPAARDQRRCLLEYLARSDRELDRTYQALIGDLKREGGTLPGDAEPVTVQRLRKAQRAWLVYRDTECRRRNRGREGPLWAPVRAECLGEFSADRQMALRMAREGK